MGNMKFSAPRIVAFSVTCLLPLAEIALGIILLMVNTIINISFIITFIVIPVCTVMVSAWLIFSNIKIVGKTLFVILVLCVSAYVFAWLNVWGFFEMLDHYEGEAVSCYETVTEEFPLMPKLSEVGAPEQLEYYDYYSQIGIFFTCDADVLICKYGEADYGEQKELVLDSFVFQKDQLTLRGYSCEPSVDIDGYHFRMLSVDENPGGELDYPKKLMFVATNDETREILYLSFCDYDLDYIESLTEFILDSCGWKHMR